MHGVPLLAGPYLAAAALLALAGIQKLLHPTNTTGAVRAMGLPANDVVVRAGALIEAALGLGAIFTGEAAFAIGIAASYTAFAGFVGLALLRRTPIGTCGCFGEPDTPPTFLHVVVTVGAAASALAVVGDDIRFDGGEAWEVAAFTLLTAVTAALAYLALTELARLRGLLWRRR